MSRTRNKAWNEMKRMGLWDFKNPTDLDVLRVMVFIFFRFKWVILDYFKPKFKLENSIFPLLLGIGIDKIRNPKTQKDFLESMKKA